MPPCSRELEMSWKDAYQVVVRHNLVTAVESIQLDRANNMIADNLQVTLKLAENYRQNGCIDGEYVFSSIHRAKDFALVALDFIKKLMEKSEQGLEAHNFYSEPDWINPSAAKQQELQH